MDTKLKTLLDDRGIKASWLADQVGISKSLMSLIINGKRNMTKRNRKAIARVLRVSQKSI